MLLESLVLYSCLNGYNCPVVSANYLIYNKKVEEQAKINVQYIEYYTGSIFIGLIVPVSKAISSRELEIQAAPHIFFYVNDKFNAKVSLSKTF